MATWSSAWMDRDHVHLAEFKSNRIPRLRIIQPDDSLISKGNYIILFYTDWIGEFRFIENTRKGLYSHLKKESKINSEDKIIEMVKELNESLEKVNPNERIKYKYVAEIYAEKFTEPVIMDYDEETLEPLHSYSNSSPMFMVGVKRAFELLIKQYHLVCWTALNENARRLWDHLVLKKKMYNSIKFGELYLAMSDKFNDSFRLKNVI